MKTLEEIKRKINNRFGNLYWKMVDSYYPVTDEIVEMFESTISQTKQELIEEIKKTIENKKDDLIAQEKFCSNCIKERDEEDDELTGEIEPCQTHLISWFNIQTLEELLEKLNNK